MADFKLRNEKFLIDYDGSDFIFNIKDKEPKKITSRRFPLLLNESKFNSVGYCILEMYNLTESQAFDNYYTLRGAVAEHFAEIRFKQRMKDNGKEVETIRFTPHKFPKMDQFYDKENFGGVIDIAVKSPQEERAVIEVKGKHISKLKEVDLEAPKEEVAQGELLAYLSRVDKYYMAYVFFEDVQEDKMKRITESIVAKGYKVGDIVEKQLETVLKVLGFGLNDLTIKIYKFDIDELETKQRMDRALEIVNRAKKTGKIPANYFSMSEVSYLRKHSTATFTEDPAIRDYFKL